MTQTDVLFLYAGSVSLWTGATSSFPTRTTPCFRIRTDSLLQWFVLEHGQCLFIEQTQSYSWTTFSWTGPMSCSWAEALSCFWTRTPFVFEQEHCLGLGDKHIASHKHSAEHKETQATHPNTSRTANKQPKTTIVFTNPAQSSANTTKHRKPRTKDTVNTDPQTHEQWTHTCEQCI